MQILIIYEAINLYLVSISCPINILSLILFYYHMSAEIIETPNRIVPKEMTQAEQKVLSLWQEVPEKEKGELIARLLDNTESWHQYAITDGIALSWLKAMFEHAELSFLPKTSLPQDE